MENLFAIATREKYRFTQSALPGRLSVEDLWNLSSHSLNVVDDIHKELKKQQKNKNEDSLLVKQSAADNVLDNKVEIVKYIVEYRLAQIEVRENLLAIIIPIAVLVKVDPGVQ